MTSEQAILGYPNATAGEILGLSDRQLFPDLGIIEEVFRRMAHKWHPDHNSGDHDAGRVFAHITEMREKAKARSRPLQAIFQREDRSSFTMQYLRKTTGEGCDIYIGASSLAYVVGKGNIDLADRASAHKWKYANADMEKEMASFLPNLVREHRLSDGSRMFIYRRTPDQILMSDLLSFEGKIAPVHATWMVSRLVNIACYLEYAKIAHCAIAPEFLLVSLDHHGVSLTGPALYAATIGNRPKAVPSRTLSAVPSLLQKATVADTKLDGQLIRQTALELLGDPSGNRIRSNPDVRSEIITWLTTSPAKTAVADYEAWEVARGPRKFAHYGKTAQDFYAA